MAGDYDPYARRQNPYAGLDYLRRNAKAEIYRMGVVNMRDVFRAALASGALEGFEMLASFARALEELTRSSRTQVAEAHHQVAQHMADATVDAYQAARARGRNTPPYRPPFLSRESERDANGRLLRALKSDLFFRGTNTGIGFINEKLLNDEAKQWHRLNFGAGAAAGAPAQPVRVTWQGALLTTVGLRDGPSEPFSLPVGIWVEGGFYPRGAVPRFPTKGIKGEHFLDAGLKVLDDPYVGLAPTYERLYSQWCVSAARQLGPLHRVARAGHVVAPPTAGPSWQWPS